MKKRRFYHAHKVEDEWDRIEKRGYGDYEISTYSAIELSKRNGGQEIGIMNQGEILSIFFKGKKTFEREDLEELLSKNSQKKSGILRGKDL